MPEYQGLGVGCRVEVGESWEVKWTRMGEGCKLEDVGARRKGEPCQARPLCFWHLNRLEGVGVVGTRKSRNLIWATLT